MSSRKCPCFISTVDSRLWEPCEFTPPPPFGEQRPLRAPAGRAGLPLVHGNSPCHFSCFSSFAYLKKIIMSSFDSLVVALPKTLAPGGEGGGGGGGGRPQLPRGREIWPASLNK